MARWSNQRILSQSALDSMLKKTARRISDDIAKKTSQVLKNKVDVNIYQEQPGRISGAYRSYFSGRPLVDAVYYENSVYDFDSYTSEVGFDVGHLQMMSAPPKLRGKERHLGRYTDIHGNFVGDDLIYGEWLEEGTSKPPSIVSHPGAYFMEETVQMVEDWISGSYINVAIEKEMGSIVTEVIK